MNRCGLFDSFDYRAGSWSRPRIIIYKAEITQGKTTRVLSLRTSAIERPSFFTRKSTAPRGRMGRLHQESQTFLHSDRTSCHRFPANQFRLFLHSAAYVLVHAIKHIGMQGTQWTTSTSIRSNSASSKSAPECGSKPPGFAFTSDVVSPQGLDEDDRPQPRHGVNAHTDGDVQKIDHQHDQGITSLKRKAIRPDTATYDYETRTRQSQLSEKRLRVPSSNGSRSNSANS